MGIPYHLYSDVTVGSGPTLTIEPGVVVKFPSGKKLTIQGAYVDAATIGNPVVFTSYRDDSYGGDTNGDGPSSGARGDWGGIYFYTNQNVFDHALVRYAGATIYGPSITMRNTTFDYTPNPAVRIQSGGSGTTIHNLNFLHWSGYGVRNDTGSTIDARNNWWGDSSGPSGVGPGSGAGVTSNVLYDPWLSSPAMDDGDGPVITSSPSTAAVALHPYRYDADSRASASGTGPIAWIKIVGPDDFHIDANTGEITWAPIEPGDYVVGIAASDDVGATDQIWQIHVDVTGDTTSPQIADFTHTITDEGGGLVTAELIATFNEKVQVRPVDVALLDSAGDPVTITSVSYEVATHKLTIVAEHLTENSTYTLRLLDTITDDALNPLDGEFDGHTFPTGNGSPGGDFSCSFPARSATQVIARQVFYNNSAFDDPDRGRTDDDAMAPDPAGASDPSFGKAALLPGDAATFQNYTSYHKGLNGIMVDIVGHQVTPSLADFEFHVGNDDDPASWPEAPQPISFTVREDTGVEGQDRVVIIWDDHAINNTWLQVRVKAEQLGLESDDVFYFGNAPGEAGDSDGHAMVNTADEMLTRSNPKSPRDPAAIDDPYDFNRDGLVDVTDRIIARANRTGVGTALRLISPPQQDAGTGGGLGSAVGHDVVLERAARQEPSGETTSLGKLAWLFDLDELRRGRRSSPRPASAQPAVDQLLADSGPQ